MKTYVRVMKAVSIMGQLGFTILTPPLVMTLLGWWLQDHFGLGGWIMALTMIIGLLTAGVSAYQFYRRVLVSAHKKAKEQEQQEEKPVVFYHHE